MTLTLVSAEAGYNIYEDAYGNEVLGTPLPVVSPLTLWHDFDLESAWFAAVQRYRENPRRGSGWSPNRAEFVAEVRREIADTDAVNIVWCENCEYPTNGDTAEEVSGGNRACQSCYEDYYPCGYCGDTVHSDSLNSTLHDESVCTRCSDNNYSYCEECDGYYHSNYYDDHRHGGCDCESLAQHFMMRNGEGLVCQDERFSMTLPAGVISEEGINQITALIRQHSYTAADAINPTRLYTGPVAGAALEVRNKWWNLADAVSKMDSRWQTKDGNFTKRLSKLAHQSQALKFPPELLTKVGNVARDNSAGADLEVEMTRNLNLPAGDFYHGDSCWWQSYSDSRCSLKTNGGIGMRTFEDSHPLAPVTGRAWVQPLRLDEQGELTPTFDAMTADAFMVYNGYGNLSGYVPARIVADMAGMTYCKIGFDASPQYINNDSGYLVTTEEIAAKYTTRRRLSLHVDQHSDLYYREEAARKEARELVNA